VAAGRRVTIADDAGAPLADVGRPVLGVALAGGVARGAAAAPGAGVRRRIADLAGAAAGAVMASAGDAGAAVADVAGAVLGRALGVTGRAGAAGSAGELRLRAANRACRRAVAL